MRGLSSESRMRKVTLRLFAADVEVLKKFYPELGYNHPVRALVHKHCRQLETNAALRLSQSEIMDGSEFQGEETSHARGEEPS
jgi:hypothetical protein